MIMGSRSTDVLYPEGVKSTVLERWLENLKVMLGSIFTCLPMHSAKKDLGKGLVKRSRSSSD